MTKLKYFRSNSTTTTEVGKSRIAQKLYKRRNS